MKLSKVMLYLASRTSLHNMISGRPRIQPSIMLTLLAASDPRENKKYSQPLRISIEQPPEFNNHVAASLHNSGQTQPQVALFAKWTRALEEGIMRTVLSISRSEDGEERD